MCEIQTIMPSAWKEATKPCRFWFIKCILNSVSLPLLSLFLGLTSLQNFPWGDISITWFAPFFRLLMLSVHFTRAITPAVIFRHYFWEHWTGLRLSSLSPPSASPPRLVDSTTPISRLIPSSFRLNLGLSLSTHQPSFEFFFWRKMWDNEFWARFHCLSVCVTTKPQKQSCFCMLYCSILDVYTFIISSSRPGP